MESIVAKISSKYQIVIPKWVRESLHLKPGDSLLFVVDRDVAFIRPRPDNFTEALRGLHREVWADKELETWLDQERAQWG